MSSKRIVARNAIWNWAGVGAGMITGFLVSPFSIRMLGDSGYGLWILIASLTGYFGLLDLGMRGSVGRHIAYYRGKDDQENVNVMFSTAISILGVACLIALIATFAILAQFLRLFDIPTDQVYAAKIALVYVGISFAFMLPFSVFDAVLWGFQRFDLINGIDIFISTVRASLTFYFLGRGYGIVGLAQVTLVTSQLGYLLKALACFWVDPELRFRVRFVTRAGAGKLFSYGMWNFVLSVSGLLTSQMSTLIVGARIGVSLLTPYSIANRLVGYGISLVSSGASVLTPYSANLSGGGKEDAQRNLFIYGGRICLAFTLFFTYNFIFLGGSLIRLWQGPGQVDAIPLLWILMVGDTLAVSQQVSVAIILGTGRPRILATINFCDALGVLGSTWFLSRYGLFWVTVGFGVSATLIRGVATLTCGAAAAGATMRDYFLKSLLPALAATSIPALILALAVRVHAPATWAELFLYGGCFTAIYGCGCIFLIGTDRARELFDSLRRRKQRV